MTKLIIVESPGKISKIRSYIGQDWVVEASRGHVRDLPEDSVGIDIEHGYRLEYRVIPDKKGVISRLKKVAQSASAIYIATDPDREGEAIGWHILELLKTEVKNKPIFRVTFSAITKQAILKAIAEPRQLDMLLVEAQQTRRAVDRLVGYPVSGLVCKAMKAKVSAGRVQTVCLRLVVDREREIQAFKAEKYWTLDVKLKTVSGEFKARVTTIQNKNVQINQPEQIQKLTAGMNGAAFWVADVKQGRKPRRPLPPFTTSTLQQAASKALALSPEKTMSIAQVLYEAGLITYMRTDSVVVAPEAQTAARDYIQKNIGEQYLPTLPQVYETKAQNAQEAHEAIRPADVSHTPDQMEEGEGSALYRLIWKRFIASQMADAQYDLVAARILAGKQLGQPYPVEFKAQGRTLVFDGFLKVYEETPDEDDSPEPDDPAIPPLAKDQPLAFIGWQPEEHTTKAPGRYTEASLIQSLERNGIGRPSTFASMVKTVKDKGYVRPEKKRLVPTALGIQLIDFLVPRFPIVFDYGYTAQLETGLDAVAAGKITRIKALDSFWKSALSAPLETLAKEVAHLISPDGVNKPKDPPKVVGKCAKCGANLVERQGAKGVFAGCSRYPKCKGAAKPVKLTAPKGGHKS